MESTRVWGSESLTLPATSVMSEVYTHTHTHTHTHERRTETDYTVHPTSPLFSQQVQIHTPTASGTEGTKGKLLNMLMV